MKNWFKKQKYKIAIALCSLLSIFTLFLGINKTYAYETDSFSYTIDKSNIVSVNTYCSIDNVNSAYTDIILNDVSNYSSSIIGFPIIIDNEHDNINNIFLMNFDILYSTDNINYSSLNNFLSSNGSFPYQFGCYSIGSSTNSSFLIFSSNFLLRSSQYNFNNNHYYTIVAQSRKTNAGTENNRFSNLYIRNIFQMINQVTLQSYYKLRIYNIDFVHPSQVGLQQYYDTYYGQIEDNYNTLLDNYNTLQEDFTTLEGNYNILESNYNTLQSDYNTLLSQKNALEQEIITKQNQINTLTNELNRLNSEYNNIINVSAPFNPNNIGVATVLFNNTLLDIPYNSFVIFDYFQIELDLFDFDLIDNYNANSNHLIITLNLSDPKDFGTLKYWCNMRDSVGDYLSIYYYSDSTLLYSLEYMNNEHTDNNGDMAPYYLESANNVNRVVFDFFLNDDYSSNNPYSNNTDFLIQYGTYSQGYNDGLNAANEYNDIIINNYQVEIQGYNDVIDNLHVEVTNLKQQINIKDNQIKAYQQGANDYNLNRMIWTIASTPFESFKQIWNVNFFGVNISTMITGFITGIIVLWIIKKFFL